MNMISVKALKGYFYCLCCHNMREHLEHFTAYEIVFATSENVFCTSHLEKCGGWMVMGQMIMFFEKTEGARKIFANPRMFFAKFEGPRKFFAKLVPHPRALNFCIPPLDFFMQTPRKNFGNDCISFSLSFLSFTDLSTNGRYVEQLPRKSQCC